MFKSSTNLCFHSAAVAEKENVLSIYLDWMSTSESDCNPYHLATKNVNVRASGQKVGKERRNRKTQKNPQPSFTVTNQEQLLLAAMGTNQSAPNVSGSTTLEATNWQPTVGGHPPILSAPLASPFVGSLSSCTRIPPHRNEQAWYYHPLRECLIARHQNFNSAMIQLHSEVLVMICKEVSYIRISASMSVLHF